MINNVTRAHTSNASNCLSVFASCFYIQRVHVLHVTTTMSLLYITSSFDGK